MLYASVHPDLSDVLYACFNIYRGTDADYSNKLTNIVPITYIFIHLTYIFIAICFRIYNSHFKIISIGLVFRKSYGIYI